MKAMILAAGLGTRLRPLTDKIPKALVSVHGRTLLELAIQKLKKAGIHDIIINLHHFPQQIRDYLVLKKNFGLNIEFSEETAVPLDSGGGIKKAAWFLAGDQPFLVYNVDVVSDIDLRRMMEYHLSVGPLASLAVKCRETQRYLLFDKENRLLGWNNAVTGETKICMDLIPGEIKKLAFSGIHIISPGIFSLMEKDDSFSIIDTYLRLARNHMILAYPHEADFWCDAGKPENLPVIESFLKEA